MAEHPYGWLSLLPPLAAIVLAIVTRQVIASLLAGVFIGALITCGGNVWPAVADTLEIQLWKTLISEDKLRVFTFTLLMGAAVGVMNRAAGMKGLVLTISRWAKTRRRGQLVTWFLGLLIFFDDYANTMLLGNTMRSLYDRLKISREKLAYVVDSTAAPVAGLALLSTWVAIEIEFIRDGLNNLSTPSTLSAFDLFITSIPYRFYVILALLFVPLTAILGRDFGPMLKAERRRLGEASTGESNGMSEDSIPQDASQPHATTPARWLNAVVPILVILGVTIGLIYTTGLNNYYAEHETTATAKLRDIFGKADALLALQYGALCGLVAIALLARWQRLLNNREILAAAGAGARVVLPALAILWLASTMSRITGSDAVDGQTYAAEDKYRFQEHRLYTGQYLTELLVGSTLDQTNDASNNVAAERSAARMAAWLPTIVFLLAAVIAFATGTSWGTMGILLPMVVPLAAGLLGAAGASLVPGSSVLLGSIGGVLAGAIFGDHCSPISDTTVLSSQSSGCDHIAHVRTQMPYALVVGVIAIVLGTLPAGYGVSVWILLPLAIVVMIVVLYILGRPVVENT